MHSMTSLMAAVALATKIRSKCSGSALKKRSNRTRFDSICFVESIDDGDCECGLPKRLFFMSFAKDVMRDLGYGVVPAWSRYVVSI